MTPLEAAVARARAVDILDVVERLGVAGLKKRGTERIGPCPACGGRDRFAINPRLGLFNCRNCGGGDGIDLVRFVCGSSLAEAVAFVNGAPIRFAGKRPSESRARTRASEKESETQARRDAFVAGQIKTLVRELAPVRGTPGEAYLREIRGIDVDAIVDVLERVDAIGWHPQVYFNESGHPLNGRHLGCIVGVMTDPVTAQPTGAISRTYLDQNLRKVGKAKTLGAPARMVRLSPDEDVLEGLVLGEGLETCLAAAANYGLRPIWSTGSAATMGKFPVLSGIEALTLLADHDDAGEDAARKTEARWLAAGREVLIHRPRTIGSDLNDTLKGA
jgi:hypothetical protein